MQKFHLMLYQVHNFQNKFLFPLILIFSAYAVLIKPTIFLLLFGLFGFRKHTMFQTAINLSQVSEFSLIILLVGLKMGLVSQGALTVIAVSSVVSITFSSLMISQSKKIYKNVMSVVSFFERKKHLSIQKEDEKLE